MLVVAIDLASFIVAREGAEDVFEPLKLGSCRGGSKNEEED